MGKSVLLEILNSPDTKKGAAHRAAPLADSPTSCPLSIESKKALPPVLPLGTNRRGISQGSLEEWRAVYQSLSEVVPSSDMPRHTDVPGTLAASLICRKALF